MPRKTQFTIPLGDVRKAVSKDTKTKRGSRNTEEIIPLHSSKSKKSGQPSVSKKLPVIHTEAVKAQTSRHHSNETEELHPLHFIEAQDDITEDVQTAEGPPQSHVCTSFVSTSLYN